VPKGVGDENDGHDIAGHEIVLLFVLVLVR